MAESVDVERLRAGYQAFNRGDYQWVLDNLDPGVELRDRDEIPDPQTYHGLDEAVAQFTRVGSEFDDYRVEPQEVIDLGEHIVVVALQSGRGRSSGVPVEETVVHAWRIRDGKVIGMRAYSTREDALRAVAGQ